MRHLEVAGNNAARDPLSPGVVVTTERGNTEVLEVC